MRDEAVVKMETNWDMWAAIEASPDPVVALDQRTREQLAMNGFSEQELAFVSTDPRYQQSVREEYQACRSRIREKGKFPDRITIHFTKPGTRDRKGRDISPEPANEE